MIFIHLDCVKLLQIRIVCFCVKEIYAGDPEEFVALLSLWT